MKWLSFIVYLFRNGSLGGKPLNFEQRHREIIAPVFPYKNQKPVSLYIKIRNRLSQSIYIGKLLGNLAYAKNVKKMHKQYFFIDRYKICYVRILKSASTSILRELLPHIDPALRANELNDRQVDVLADRYFESTLSDERKEYACFTIVRNPFHRIVSVYLDLYNPDNNFFSYQSYLFGIIKKEMSFKEFVTAVSQIPDLLKSSHFSSQYYILKASCGLTRIKYFRLEHDQNLLHAFLAGIQIEIPHSNKQTLPYDYRTFYDNTTVKIVYDLYKNDIEYFDYKKEYNSLLSYLSSS